MEHLQKPVRGRPKKVVDPVKVQALAEDGHTNEEIAARLSISVSTLTRLYADPLKRGKFYLTASLRSEQVKLAKSGNATMLIWLGKQMLGQRDKTEFSGPDGGPIQHQNVELSQLTDEQVRQIETLVESAAKPGTNQG